MGQEKNEKEKEKEHDERLDEKDEEREAEKLPDLSLEPQEVFVHSLPLLSTVDHHTRVKSKKGKRVVGVLLGHNVNGKVHCTNSFAVPFEEDSNTAIWFFDNHYLEDMCAMFKKVNTKEAIVGWYSTGPKLKNNDMEIHELVRRYCPNPVYLIVRVNEEASEERMPCTAYKTVEEIENVTSGPKLTFVHLRATLRCSAMEEVGVVHLLRDIQDYTVTSLATQVKERVNALKSLGSKLQEIKEYMELVSEGKLPMNHNIMYIVQDIFNTLPSLHAIRQSASVATEVNDQTMIAYLGTLLRSVVALHNLILNKFEMKRLKEEEEAAARAKIEKEEKEKAEKEEKEKAEKEKAEAEKDGDTKMKE
eukprot:TRINITY_DN10767_c0_g3_i1.p2 TRINITY_DN10767_c0_g3~~TRINITY_DN10767_c0_g3_i1.p2  ORF type:complete len:362 (+),score=213.72 TRINITY_DN10767_c0_g3_i1:45-1130(+)